jgi:hypothetical protein
MSAMEWGINRPGGDYSSFEQPVDDPAYCSNRCARDPKCLAWTFVRPNIQGPSPRCWLKNRVPDPQPNGCCVSGTKLSETQSESRMEWDIDRPGSYYANFDLAADNPALCRDRCQKDPRCRAWTYVKPGVQGPAPRCWLKNAVPPVRRDVCCVSGTKTDDRRRAAGPLRASWEIGCIAQTRSDDRH